MRTLEFIGYNRTALGKKDAHKLRKEGNVPCVIYGGDENVHFYAPAILFRDLVYTPDAAFVNIDVEGKEYKCILQDVTFHPVSEIIMHADFLLLKEGHPVRMEIPVEFVGKAPGLQQGGKLIAKIRKIRVKAVPASMPSTIKVDISGLDLGKSIKVGALEQKDYEILYNPLVTIASVGIPRALRSTLTKGEEEEAGEEA